MRTLMVGAAVAAYLGTAGLAAADGMYEGSMKDAPAPIAPVINWTGLYVGAGVGGGALTHELDVSILGGLLTFGQDYGGEGFFGTLQVGYDYQIAPRWVVGAFADFDWVDMDARVISVGLAGFPLLNASIETDSMWTVGGRVGYLITPETMVYGLLGYTSLEFDGLNGSLLGGAIPFNIALSDADAVTVGAGMETQLGSNFALKLEYRYSDFDSENIAALTIPPLINTQLDTDLHTARAVLTYKFNFGY